MPTISSPASRQAAITAMELRIDGLLEEITAIKERLDELCQAQEHVAHASEDLEHLVHELMLIFGISPPVEHRLPPDIAELICAMRRNLELADFGIAQTARVLS